MNADTNPNNWYDDEADDEPIDYPIHEYDITASPNDFNVSTLFSYIDRGTIHIPGFQRNYVWDIKRASKLIESLIIGLPIPQIFLYEEARNKFSVIDGQQRLMSLYYFVQQRFPKKEKRAELRRIFEENGIIPLETLQDDAFFTKFNLSLPTNIPHQLNKFHGLNYSTLGDYQSTLDLRPIRSIIVKQVAPADDDSAIYEIFNRLNSGGVNLRPQEIRTSLYHSHFYDMLYRVNMSKDWRRLVGILHPDLNLKDIEFMLRGFAMLITGNSYSSSMVKFLNDFSRHAKKYTNTAISYFEQLFISFLHSCSELPPDAFLGTTQRFSITIFESVFVAACTQAFQEQSLVQGKITPNSIDKLKQDKEFTESAERATASKGNVEKRLSRAKQIIETQLL